MTAVARAKALRDACAGESCELEAKSFIVEAAATPAEAAQLRRTLTSPGGVCRGAGWGA